MKKNQNLSESHSWKIEDYPPDNHGDYIVEGNLTLYQAREKLNQYNSLLVM